MSRSRLIRRGIGGIGEPGGTLDGKESALARPDAARVKRTPKNWRSVRDSNPRLFYI